MERSQRLPALPHGVSPGSMGRLVFGGPAGQPREQEAAASGRRPLPGSADP